jgi:hypothetical protein
MIICRLKPAGKTVNPAVVKGMGIRSVIQQRLETEIIESPPKYPPPVTADKRS